MEILSTGEKIKRARIYQGITLKELCGDKVSISKMSCIENGKIKADKEILYYISNKLGIDYDYLVRDVEEQIVGNLELIRNNLVSEDEIDNVINHNLKYALEYSYNDLAFELIHRLFKVYVENNKVENIQLIISQYYDLYQKNNTHENTIIYYTDMATFFYSIKEYNGAVNYYSRTKDFIKHSNEFDKINYAYICYKEGKCYAKLALLEEAYSSLKEAVRYIDYVTDSMEKGDIYHWFATISIRLKKKDADKYINMAYEYQKEDSMVMAIAKWKNSESYFYVNEREKAIQEIKEGISLFQPNNKSKYVKFLNKCIRTLYNNEEYDYAYEISDTALNSAIDTDDIVLIEDSYYLKGMILQKKGLYVQAEMYMNLSLDSLFKFGNKEKRYGRYLDMAEMYYNLGEVKDSLKYFTLAMKVSKD